MLIRKTIQFCDPDLPGSPFIIYNTQEAPTDYAIDISAPAEIELTAPSLRIEPHFIDKDKDHPEYFWQAFDPAYEDETLPAEIMDALQGKNDAWKIIRCQPTNYGAFLVLVNPTTYDGGPCERESIEDELDCGYVWVYLNRNAFKGSCLYFDVVVQSADGTDQDRYGISRPTSRWLRFFEYDNAQRVRRMSDVYYKKAVNGLTKIEVTEYL